MIATLLWKDYRQNRRLLLAVTVFLAIPYFVVSIYGGVSRLQAPGYHSIATWPELLVGASIVSLSTLVVACAFIAGNAFAGERADRSAEFIAYLPIPRPASTVSKAILSLGPCVGFVLCNLIIAYAAALVSYKQSSMPPVEFFVNAGATGVLLFGVAWFASSFLRSAAIAAACGIMLLAIIGGWLGVMEYLNGGQGTSKIVENWYTPLCLLIGLAGFIAGCIHSLRRIEP